MIKIETLLAATSNAGKLKEIREILGDRVGRILCPKDFDPMPEPEENGATFEENALLKATAYQKLCPSAWVLADDSGLVADALNGAPGIRSARYAGPNGDSDACIEKLLTALRGASNRSAHFVTAAVLLSPDGRVFAARGEVHGSILNAREGRSGFGYDPVFFCDEIGKSFGNATESEKNAVSHRGRALRALFRQISDENANQNH